MSCLCSEVRTKIQADIAKIAAVPAFREQYIDKLWFIPVMSTPDESAVDERWIRLIRDSSVTVE